MAIGNFAYCDCLLPTFQHWLISVDKCFILVNDALINILGYAFEDPSLSF